MVILLAGWRDIDFGERLFILTGQSVRVFDNHPQPFDLLATPCLTVLGFGHRCVCVRVCRESLCFIWLRMGFWIIAGHLLDYHFIMDGWMGGWTDRCIKNVCCVRAKCRGAKWRLATSWI